MGNASSLISNYFLLLADTHPAAQFGQKGKIKNGKIHIKSTKITEKKDPSISKKFEKFRANCLVHLKHFFLSTITDTDTDITPWK